jgi:ribosome maturation factor RimP
MDNLNDELRKLLEPIIKENNLYIDKLEYAKKGKEYYLTIYLEKEDDVATLDDICKVSEIISDALDQANLIQDNYVLDVSTSGAEKPITDFSSFNKYIGKYIYVKFKNGYAGLNEVTGTLEKVENDTLTISYKVKTRVKFVDVQISNISKSNLAIKF